MTLANVKPTMEHYWNIVQANGQTIQNWKNRDTTPGEALLVLTCQSLFDGQITEETITPAHLSGTLCTTEFQTLQTSSVAIDRNQIKFSKPMFSSQEYPKITNIAMQQITNYNKSSEKNTNVQIRNSAQLALDELTLMYLASKAIPRI